MKQGGKRESSPTEKERQIKIQTSEWNGNTNCNCQSRNKVITNFFQDPRARRRRRLTDEEKTLLSIFLIIEFLVVFLFFSLSPLFLSLTNSCYTIFSSRPPHPELPSRLNYFILTSIHLNDKFHFIYSQAVRYKIPIIFSPFVDYKNA